VCEVCAKKKGNPKVRGKCLGTGDMQRVPVFTRPKRARDGGGEGGGGGGGASAAAPATTSPKGTKRQPGSMQVGDSVSFYELQSGKAGSYYGAQHCRSQMGKDGQKRRVQLVKLTEKPDGSGLLRFKRLVSQAGDEVQSRSADTQWELPAGAVTGTEKLGCACTSLEPGSHFTWNSNTHAKNARQRSIKKDCMGTFSAAGLLELVAFENFAVRMDGE